MFASWGRFVLHGELCWGLNGTSQPQIDYRLVIETRPVSIYIHNRVYVTLVIHVMHLKTMSYFLCWSGPCIISLEINVHPYLRTRHQGASSLSSTWPSIVDINLHLTEVYRTSTTLRESTVMKSSRCTYNPSSLYHFEPISFHCIGF